MKQNNNNNLILAALVVAALVYFWPSIQQHLGGLAEPARELTITIVNQSEQAQNVMVQPPPAIQPQPVQQAAPSFTPGQLADCAYAQAAGLPSAGCPENAGEVLGVGR